MKTQKYYTALMIILTVLFAITLRGSDLSHSTLSPDLSAGNFPDRKAVSMNLVPLTEPVFEEEGYINDIPFSTECVSKRCQYEQALRIEFCFDEEEFVDDIPFNTTAIFEETNYQTVLNQDFLFTDEEYINDIPFNTCQIANDFHKDMTNLSVNK